MISTCALSVLEVTIAPEQKFSENGFIGFIGSIQRLGKFCVRIWLAELTF